MSGGSIFGYVNPVEPGLTGLFISEIVPIPEDTFTAKKIPPSLLYLSYLSSPISILGSVYASIIFSSCIFTGLPSLTRLLIRFA